MANKTQSDKFLPIGTVAMLENATKRVMITGYCSVEEGNNKKIWDYCGCTFPEGIVSTDITILFDHSQIKKIYHIGLAEDDEEKLFQGQLNEAYKKVQKIIEQSDNLAKKK